MVSQKYRWDFIGLSTDEKPTSETSDKVVNGSTYYCSDTSKLYVYCDGTWYERKPLGSGGGGGTSDFNDLSNRPKYKGSEMSGSTNIPEVVTYSNFTGTDGSTAGVAGLVPAPATTDAGKFLKADGTWDTAGGGSGPTVVQTTGTSTTDVMSQNAVTSTIFKDPSTQEIVKIGKGSFAGDTRNVSIGYYATAGMGGAGHSVAVGGQAYAPNPDAVALGSPCNAQADGAIAIGRDATVYSGVTMGEAIGYNSKANSGHEYSVAIGAYASTTRAGEINIGTGTDSYGYNSTSYRVLGGVHDPVDAHDAATKGYVDPSTDSSAPTTATVGRLGQIQIDTTTATAYMCVAVDTVTPAYTWKQITA